MALVLGAAATAGLAIGLLAGGEQVTGVAVARHPAPITRAEVLQRYAEINPLDRSATPAAVDSLASFICESLNEGGSTDAAITLVTDSLRSQATEVVRLMVAYQCPKYLVDFK